MGVIGGVDQLRPNADPAAFPLNAALQNGGHVQLLTDLADIPFRTLVPHRRCHGDDLQIGQTAEFADDGLGHSVAEIFLIPGGAEIPKGQHGDGILPGDGLLSRSPDRLSIPGGQKRLENGKAEHHADKNDENGDHQKHAGPGEARRRPGWTPGPESLSDPLKIDDQLGYVLV